LQGKAELLAKFVHDEKPLPVVFLADTTRSEDRLLVTSLSSPAPRALPPGAFTARATRPFNSYPHDPPQSGNAPVLLTHIAEAEETRGRQRNGLIRARHPTPSPPRPPPPAPGARGRGPAQGAPSGRTNAKRS